MNRESAKKFLGKKDSYKEKMHAYEIFQIIIVQANFKSSHFTLIFSLQSQNPLYNFHSLKFYI